jgi:hypothetical protein
MTYSNIGDKIIALAKVGYATNNVDKTMMKGIADWARTHTNGWTLSATDPKTGTVDPSWSPNQEDWSDVYDFAVQNNYTPLIDYLKSSGYYFKQAAPIVSQVNNPMQASQALSSQGVTDQNNPYYTGAAVGYTPPTQSNSNQLVQGESGGVSTPQYSMDSSAQDRFNSYQQSALNASYNANDAETAYAQSIINSGGIWKTLQPIAEKQMQDSIDAISKTAAIAKANVEASKASLNAQEAADYDEVIRTIDDNLVAARHRTTEELNQRGMFFSTVLDYALGDVEAASANQRANAAGQHKARLAKIASDMAILSANIDTDVIKGNAAAVAAYTAQMLQVVAQDEQTKRDAQALVAKLTTERSGIPYAIAAQTFATGEQMRAQSISEANTAEDREKNDFVQTVGQYSGNYQDAIDKLDPSDPLYTWKLGVLKGLRNEKLATQASTDLETFKTYVSSLPESTDFQAMINKLDKNDPNYMIKVAYLNAARNAKIANIDAAKRKQFTDTILSYQGNDNYATSIRNIQNDKDTSNDWQIPYLKAAQQENTNATNAAALEQQGASVGGTSGSKGVWTDAQARSFKTAYEEVRDTPVGSAVTTTQAQDPNVLQSFGTINANSKWTDETKAAYLKANKGLYDSAMDYINRTTTTMLNPNNKSLPAEIRAVLQSMIDNGTPLTMENLRKEIQEYYEAPTVGGYGADGGADYALLMSEYNQLPF